jgi:hypothetical protein
MKLPYPVPVPLHPLTRTFAAPQTRNASQFGLQIHRRDLRRQRLRNRRLRHPRKSKCSLSFLAMRDRTGLRLPKLLFAIRCLRERHVLPEWRRWWWRRDLLEDCRDRLLRLPFDLEPRSASAPSLDPSASRPAAKITIQTRRLIRSTIVLFPCS